MSQNSLLGRFDLDPGPWRPMWYGVEIDVPVTLDGQGQGSINLNNQPFILTRISHRIIGCTWDWETTGLMQDGQYTVDMKDEQSSYQNIPIQAELMFGKAVGGGDFDELPYPIPFAGNRTVLFRVVNRCARTLSPEADYFTVGLCLAGIANWGVLDPESKCTPEMRPR